MPEQIDVNLALKTIMKKLGFLLFASATILLGSSLVQAEDRSELPKENIAIEAKFVSSTSDRMYFRFFGETTDYWYSNLGTTVETDPETSYIAPFKVYELNVWGLDDTDTYDISVSAPPGYFVYISNAGGNDLIKRDAVLDVEPDALLTENDPHTYKIEIIPSGSRAANPGFAVATSLAGC